MKLSTILLLILLLKSYSADILSCNSALGFSIPTMCRVSGGSVADSEPLQISNANSTITTLTFTNTSFNFVPLNTFVNFPKVKVFYVTYNNLNSFPSSSFQNAKQLTQLLFSYNQITTIPDQAFGLCTALTQLTIDDNPITTISGNPFLGLNKLQELTLEDLPLQSFDSSVLTDLPALQNLKMGNCSLTTIDKNFLINNPKVTDITLSYNKIVTIEADAFTNLLSLVNLDVSYNMIISLNTAYAQNVMAENNQLKSIYIGKSAIRVNIDNNLVSNLSCDSTLNNKFLYASNNHLSKIACVGKMTNALLIYLDSNRLGKISRNIFVNLKNVRTFAINANPKLKLGSKMLASMSKLNILQVDKFVNGYKNLSQMFPKLDLLYLTTKDWTCTYLTNVANILNAQKIYLFFNNETLDKANFKCQLNTWDVSHFNVSA